jgi:hypothetical protein
MVPACDDFLLDQSHKLFALRQGQAQIRDVAKVGWSIVITSTLRLDPSIPVATRPTPFLIPSQPVSRPVIPCSPPPPQSLDSPVSRRELA